MNFDKLVEDTMLRELLIIDKEYKKQGRDVEKEGIEESVLKQRVKTRLLLEHPELTEQVEMYY